MLLRMEDERDPLAELDKATDVYRQTERAHKAARDVAVTAVVSALRAGERPTDVVRRSPFTDAYVRRIAREAGIAPRRKGKA